MASGPGRSSCRVVVANKTLLVVSLLFFWAAAAAAAGPGSAHRLPASGTPVPTSSSSGAAVHTTSAAGHQQPQQHPVHPHTPQVQLIRRSLVADAALAATSATAADAASATAARAVPVYGNWCGPNYGSGTPVNEIDDCCRSHDICYDNTAYNHCGCDQDLVRCLNRITSIKSNQLVKRAMRASIVTYFDNTACRCSSKGQICMPVKSCMCPADG